MIEKRWYYTDPLAAAWMAKHFDMKFKILKPVIAINDGISESPYCSEGFIGVMMWNGNKLLGSRPHHPDEALHIHSDSLHLLEPQIGDLALCEIDDMNHPEAEFQMVTFDPQLFDARHGVCRILMRGGKPFFWPESDGA